MIIIVEPGNMKRTAALLGMEVSDVWDVYHADTKKGDIRYIELNEVVIEEKNLGRCFYVEPDDGGPPFCIEHQENSKHNVHHGSRLPCLRLDP